MDVLLFREAQFQKALAAMRVSGGVASKAAEEVDRILGRLTNGAAPAEAFGRLTKNGESRIPHCLKYDLGSGHRLVCVQDDHAVQILFVGKHDDCDRWIERHRGHRLVVDAKTKRLSAIHEITVEDPLPPREYRPVFDPNESLIERPDEHHLDLLDLRAADFRKISALTVTSSDDDILEAVTRIGDERLRDAILGLLLELHANRVESAQALIQKYSGSAKAVDEAPGLLEDALASGVNTDVVVNLRDLSEQEVQHLFGQSQFHDWLLFLHPDQKPVVEADYAGPLVLRGVSGSGKTCVVVHRARHLAGKYADRRIAVLTLNPALAALIDDLLTALCPAAVRERIDVIAIADLCRSIVAHYDPGRPMLEYDPRSTETLEDNWTDTFNNPEQLERLRPIITSLATTYEIDAERYIRDEFIWVRSAFARSGAGDPDSVLPGRDIYRDPERSPRRGREVPFIRDWRDRILKALDHYEDWSQSGGFYDSAALTLLAHRHVGDLRRKRAAHLDYRAVLVDEVQDLGKVELEIIRALAPTTENGLFLSGDPRQQVFPKDHDLAGAGVVVGQKKFFRKNYRNTRQILHAGVALIKQFGAAGQAGDDIEVLDPEYSARDSAMPLVVAAPDQQSEISFIAQYVGLKRSLDDHPVCIVACGLREDDEAGLARLRDQLQTVGLATTRLHRESRVRPGSVFLSALETVKGFEFSLVLVCQCGENQIPVPSLPEEESWRDASRLYVALTRARDELVITHTGAPSRFLKGIEQTLRWSTTQEQGLGEQTDAGHELLRTTEADADASPKPVVAAPPLPPPPASPKQHEAPQAASPPARQASTGAAKHSERDDSPPAANERIMAELARLKAENQRLKNAGKPANHICVSEKGGVSVYGLGRFPVTLYKDQWSRLLEMEKEIREFIRANEANLSRKS